MTDHDEIVRLGEQLTAHRLLVEQYQLLTATALQQAAVSVDARLLAMNEFRGALADAQANFVTKDEHRRDIDDGSRARNVFHDEWVRGHAELVDRVNGLATTQAAMSGTSTGTMRIFLVAAVMLSLAGLLFSVINALVR